MIKVDYYHEMFNIIKKIINEIVQFETAEIQKEYIYEYGEIEPLCNIFLIVFNILN